MNWQRVVVPIAGAALAVWAWRVWGPPGLAVAFTAAVMWVLLHVTRLVTVMSRAARRPIGHVDSAVMLNAKLRAGRPLIHVVALTRSLGAPRSLKDASPEVYEWRDTGGSTVRCEFDGGKLARWTLTRPSAEADAAAPIAAATAGDPERAV